MISVIILTKNEEENITACINSVTWCDEIIVIDDNSEDKTVELAKKLGAKVIIHDMNNNFAAQRNYGLTQAKGDWILFIDADERVSSPLWYEIMQRINEPFSHNQGYYVIRKDTMWGRKLSYGETGNNKFLRLAKKNSGKWEGIVHEIWNCQGKTTTLTNPLDHFPHTSVERFLKEINYYTSLRAQELYDKKVKANWLSILIYPKGKFLINYVIKRGFLDGIPGLLLAIIMSLHSFLVRSKLWLLWQRQTA